MHKKTGCGEYIREKMHTMATDNQAALINVRNRIDTIDDTILKLLKERLKCAQEMDTRETEMVPYILKLKSLTKVVQMFNRI